LLRRDRLDDQSSWSLWIEWSFRQLQRLLHQVANGGEIDVIRALEHDVARNVAAALQESHGIAQPFACRKNRLTQRGNNAIEKMASEARSDGA
jgi:hypothetical protein